MLNLKSLLLNPAFIFGLFLLVSLSSTYLPWSNLFDKVSYNTILIYSVSSISLILVSLYYHYKLIKNKYFINGKLLYSFKSNKSDKLIFALLMIFFILEVAYSGFVPIFLPNYTDILDLNFGIPIFHGLYLSFLSYISIVFFQKLINSNYKQYLIYIILINILFILLGRRGIIVFNILSYVFLYLYYYFTFKKINIKFIVNILLIVSLFFYAFNLIGNIRLGKSSDDYILSVGKASNEFINSGIPTPIFFGYLYISTPVNVFDLNTKNYDKSYSEYLMANVVPDFITKRIGFEDNIDNTIINGFTVGGVFNKPYLYKGNMGIVLIIIYYLFFLSLVMYMIKKRRKRALVLLSMFLSMSVLLTFQNLLNYSGYILQIYFALLFKDWLLFKYGKKHYYQKPSYKE